MSESSVISPEELKKMLDEKKVDFLFDLRNSDEFKAWHIEARADFESLNIPQEDFVGEEERHLGRFPKDKNILTVCAHGDAAKYAADMLHDHGMNAVSLQGGMDAWSEFYEVRQVSSNPVVYQIYRVARGCIAYLIASQGVAVVIDAARHVDRIRKLAASLNVRIVDIFDTHLHADHISGGAELAALSGAVYHLHPADAGGASISYEPLSDGLKFSVGDHTLEVIHSPGHTPGSTSFLLNKTYLFTGDTIMKTSIGRPDLGGKSDEWSAMLYATLFRRFQGLDDGVIVMPSHAASVREQDDRGIIATTMGQSRKERDLFQILDEAAFARYIKANLLENPERYQQIRQVNLGTLASDEGKKKELEIGKNLCGMSKQKG
jgi:glyoxylase-like metal-dependent hydrolase (beta-lactamase superfamily II)